jgi:adenylate cyclase
VYGVDFSQRLPKNVASGIVVTGLVLALVVGWAAYLQATLVARLDHLFFDAFLRISASGEPAQNTVAIDIDDRSLAAIGQWPWPRYRVAALIEAIAAAKPAAIGVDVLFPEPDRSSLVNVREAFKRDFDVDISFTGAPAGLLDNDGYLGYVLGKTHAVASKYFYFDHATGSASSPKPELRFEGDVDSLSLNDARGLMLNTPAIASQTKLSGFVNNQIDDDGRLRRIPLLIRYNGAVYGNLALATVLNSLGATAAYIEHDEDGPLIRVGAHRIPIDHKGFALLRFNGASQLYPSLSAVEVLSASFRPEDIKGKIVLVGSSAVGLNDLHNTAFDTQFPGLKVLAAMTENIATDRYVRVPSWATPVIFVECVAVAFLMSALFIAASGATAVVAGGGSLAAALFLLSSLLFFDADLFVSPAPALLVAAILFVAFSVTRFAVSRRQAYAWFKRLENSRQVTIESMAAVAETRDPETGAHIKRTQHYVKAIAEELRRQGKHKDVLTQGYIELLFISAPLHDIGKVGVPDHILLKPGRLTAEEMVQMKRHAEFGKTIIASTARSIEGDNYLVIAGEIAASHHEKWDGTGYPLGLAGEAIPLSGRIMAVADIYDALISRRCYKEPFPHEAAKRFMRGARGTTFDPTVLDAFLRIEEEVKQIAARYPD